MRKSQETKKQPKQDWHKADVKAALEKAGWSLRQLSFHHGYKHSATLKRVFQQPWPKGERLVAEAIGHSPQDIWPSRYDEFGKPNRTRGHKAKNTTTRALA